MKQIFLWPNVVDIIRGLDHFELFALTSGFLVIFLGCACLHQIVGIVTTYFRPESQSDDQATYPYPKGGWVCFHCGERFLSPNAARIHFGPTPFVSSATCTLDSDESLRQLRAQQERIDDLQQALAKIEDATDCVRMANPSDDNEETTP